MTGFEYFKQALFTNYANFDGRARRSEYWYFVLFTLLISLLLRTVTYMANDLIGTPYSIVNAISWMFSVAMFVPSAAVAVRRLHDTGKSGWLYLIIFIPIIGIIVLIIFFVIDGTPGWNEYGEDPKGRSDPDSEIMDQLV